MIRNSFAEFCFENCYISFIQLVAWMWSRISYGCHSDDVIKRISMCVFVGEKALSDPYEYE